MAEPIYFQWQNEILLKTIYPMRKTKLCDFLIFYQEIDLWNEYKQKSTAELQAEMSDYQAAQVQLIEAAIVEYTARRDYFLKTEVKSELAQAAALDPDEMRKINQLHSQFAIYFPKLGGDVRKEKYFVAQQVSNWEIHRNEVLKRLAQARRRVTLVIEQQKIAAQKEVDKLENGTSQLAEAELQKLRAFLASFGKIEKFKLKLAKTNAEAQARRQSLTLQLDGVKARLKPLAAQQQTLQPEVNRLKNRPKTAALEAYFLNPEVSTQVKARFPKTDPTLLAAINTTHREIIQGFGFAKEIYGKISALQAALSKTSQARAACEAELAKIENNLASMPANWAARPERELRKRLLRETNLPVLEAELGQLEDYLAALRFAAKPESELAKMLQEKENQLNTVKAAAAKLTSESSALEAQIAAIDAEARLPEQRKLVRLVPAQTLTAKDLATWKLEVYKTGLEQLTPEQLLELVARRFLSEPHRYPLWLQYMVIHFSGMRYQSAHGSWANPRDLLINLRTLKIDDYFKGLDQVTIAALTQDKLDTYQPPAQALLPSGPARQKPLLAQATDEKWRKKIAEHLHNLRAPDAYHQRQALIELRMDEESYEVQMMSADELNAALLSAKVEFNLPDWMWAEIVKLTDLRVEAVTDENWENLTSQQLEERNSAKWAEYRKLMNEWKQASLTGWREEHARTNQLIVTRAVCNETAEHIQHLRGNRPPGGLAAKPGWYMRLERESKTTPPVSFFVKPFELKHFKVGASIFWLEYVRKFPNPWQLAGDIKLNNGDSLLPASFIAPKPASPATAAAWKYEKGDGFKRTRAYLDDKKQPVKEEQWLRWLHEATVAEIAETAEGTVIYTFETALPGGDRNVSCIGMFKRYFSHLKYEVSASRFNPTFVGYTPEGQAPLDDLKFMLDWEKILRRPVR